MKLELKELEKEIELHQQQQQEDSDPNDLFLPTLEGFVVETANSFQKLEELLVQMRERFVGLLEYFGEETTGDGKPFTSTDEFFGVFSVFMQSFSVSGVADYCVLVALFGALPCEGGEGVGEGEGKGGKGRKGRRGRGGRWEEG
jgi:hypothetical protein